MKNNLAPLVFDGEEVDDGILEVVHYLIDGGFNTIASCQGKSPKDRLHAFPMPIVRVGCVHSHLMGELAASVGSYMAKKYKNFTLKASVYYNHDGSAQDGHSILDVMFIKSVKEEFDIATWRK